MDVDAETIKKEKMKWYVKKMRRKKEKKLKSGVRKKWWTEKYAASLKKNIYGRGN